MKKTLETITGLCPECKQIRKFRLLGVCQNQEVIYECLACKNPVNQNYFDEVYLEEKK